MFFVARESTELLVTTSVVSRISVPGDLGCRAETRKEPPTTSSSPTNSTDHHTTTSPTLTAPRQQKQQKWAALEFRSNS
jgi:hypothetical protein